MGLNFMRTRASRSRPSLDAVYLLLQLHTIEIACWSLLLTLEIVCWKVHSLLITYIQYIYGYAACLFRPFVQSSGWWCSSDRNAHKHEWTYSLEYPIFIGTPYALFPRRQRRRRFPYAVYEIVSQPGFKFIIYVNRWVYVLLHIHSAIFWPLC